MVKFALDLDVIKRKIISLSKKLCLLHVVSIASPGSFPFSEHDLEWPLTQADVESYFQCFYCILFLRLALKGHIINNLLTSSVRSLQGNLRPRPWCIDRAIARSIHIHQGLGLRYPCNDLGCYFSSRCSYTRPNKRQRFNHHRVEIKVVVAVVVVVVVAVVA